MSAPTTLSEQVLATPSGAGSIQAGETFRADPQTGTGSFAIPIAVEPGPAGIAPALAIAYSTHGGNGACGQGWSLSLAAVRRRTEKGLPTYVDGQDHFAIQGDEVVPVGGPHYRFRTDTRFAHVRHIQHDGLDAWMVEERDGTRVLYGETSTSRIQEGARIAAWHVTRKQDASGNTVEYRYLHTPDSAPRLDEVLWAGCYRIRIRWEARPDVVEDATTGFVVRHTFRVQAIEVQARVASTEQFQTYRRYDLSYDVSPWTGRSLLVAVQMVGIDVNGQEASFPAQRFTYTSAEVGRGTWHTVGGALPGRSLADPSLRLVQHTGSGLPDLLETRPGGAFLYRNLGAGQFASGERIAFPSHARLNEPGVFLSDMDQDGFADLVIEGGREVYRRAAGGGGFGERMAFRARPSFDLDDPRVRVADLTGDGRPDVLRAGPGGWDFFENVGDGAWADPVRLLRPPPFGLDDTRTQLADFTGDGMADLVWFDGRTLLLARGRGRGAFDPPVQLEGGLRLGSEHEPSAVRWVDLTGSGQADLVYLQEDNIRVSLNLAGQRLGPPQVWSQAPVSSRGRVEIGDVLGAGAQGFLYTEEAGWRFLELFADGPPDVLQSIDNGVGATTTLVYGSSSEHWARDYAAGQPWRSSMPSPQRVVDEVTVHNQVTGLRHGLRYAYRHGVHDAEDREFRGFAAVVETERELSATEQREDPQPLSSFRTARWFHTGQFVDVADEWAAHRMGVVADEVPPTAEAERALRGQPYREEVYLTTDHTIPLTLTHTTFRVYPLEADVRTGTRTHTTLPVFSRAVHLEGKLDDDRIVDTQSTYDLDTEGGGYGLPFEVRVHGHGRQGTFLTPHEQQQAAPLERLTRTDFLVRDEPKPLVVDLSGPYTPRYIGGVPKRVRSFEVVNGTETLLAEVRHFYDGADFVGLGFPGSGSDPGVTRGRPMATLERSHDETLLDQVFPTGSGARAARDARGHYLSADGALWVATGRRAFAANGQVQQEQDPRGSTTTVTYDSEYGLFPEQVVDALGHPTTFERMPFRHLVAATLDANGNRTSFAYDARQLPTSRSIQGKESSPGLGDWSGDPPTHPTEIYDYALESVPVRVTTQSREVRLGAVRTVHRYLDGLGQVLQERHQAEPDPTLANPPPRWRVTGHVVRNHRNLPVVAYLASFSDTDTYETGFAFRGAVRTDYDPLGRPLKVTYPDTTFETTNYDPWVQVKADRNDNAAHLSPTDTRYGANLAKWSNHLDTPIDVYVDAWGREIASREDNGPSASPRFVTSRQVLDAADRLLEVHDARELGQATWRYTYDLRGQPLSREHTAGTGLRWRLLDAGGNPIWSRDARGIEVQQVYDALSRPLRVESDDGGGPKLRRVWSYETYDPSDVGFGQRQAKNLFGPPEEARDADGVRFFEYDHRGLVRQATHRFWDHAWKLASDPMWSQGPAWDPAISAIAREQVGSWLALSGLSNATSVVIQTDWDSAGRPTEVRYPAGIRQRYTYGPAGLLSSTEADRGTGDGFVTVVSSVAYDEDSRPVQVRQGNGVVTDREYDPDLGRLLRVHCWLDATPVVVHQHRTYTYDPVGNPLGIEDHLLNPTFDSNRPIPNSRQFEYDPRYRLVRAQGRRLKSMGPGGMNPYAPSPAATDYEPYDLHYDYDATGNLTQNEEYSLSGLVYKAGAPDLFNGSTVEASASAPDQGSWRYDANGNTTRTPRHQLIAYAFDSQPRYVALAANTSVHELRHSDQRTVKFQRNGVFEFGLYLGAWEYRERLGTQGHSKCLFNVDTELGRQGQAEVILSGAVTNPSPWLFEVADHLGSVSTLTDRNGTLLSQEEYFAYGRSSDRRDSKNRYRYLGAERDSLTGFCILGPRFYDPVVGRFLTQDPLEQGGYVYASANPIRNLDRNGYFKEAAAAATSAAATTTAAGGLTVTGVAAPGAILGVAGYGGLVLWDSATELPFLDGYFSNSWEGYKSFFRYASRVVTPPVTLTPLPPPVASSGPLSSPTDPDPNEVPKPPGGSHAPEDDKDDDDDESKSRYFAHGTSLTFARRIMESGLNEAELSAAQQGTTNSGHFFTYEIKPPPEKPGDGLQMAANWAVSRHSAEPAVLIMGVPEDLMESLTLRDPPAVRVRSSPGFIGRFMPDEVIFTPDAYGELNVRAHAQILELSPPR